MSIRFAEVAVFLRMKWDEFSHSQTETDLQNFLTVIDTGWSVSLSSDGKVVAIV